MPRSRSNRKNRRTRSRGKEIPPPTDKWSFWVPSHDDVDSDDMALEGGKQLWPSTSAQATEASGPAHSAGPEVERPVERNDDELSEATPHPQSARLAEVSTPAHSAGGETEAAAIRHPAATAPAKHKTTYSFIAQPPPTDVDIEFRKRPSRTDSLNEMRTKAESLQQLQAEILKQSLEIVSAYNQTPGARMLPQTWSQDWKADDITKHLWHQYEDLAPIVAHRQAAAMRRHRDRAAAGLTPDSSGATVMQSPAAAAPPAVAASPMDTETTATEHVIEATVTVDLDEELDEATPRPPSTRTDALAAFYSPVGLPEVPAAAEPPYEPLASPLRVPPPPPGKPQDPRRPPGQKTAEPVVDEMLADFRRPPTPPPVTHHFRNPSPPAAPAHSAGAAKAAEFKKPAAPAHSAGAAGTARKQKITVKTVKKSEQASNSRDSDKSRSSTGSKRSRVPTGSKHPPAKRVGSRSPIREPSPSLARHIARKKSTKIRHMTPVIDACVFKNLAIECAKYQTPLTIWQTAFDSPTCQYELLGVINEFVIPSTYLPANICGRVDPSPRTPFVDHTFEQAELENAIIPWKFVLCSTLGAIPAYWRQTGTDARKYLYEAIFRDKLYRNRFNVRAVGPVGFDLRSNGHLLPGEFKGQLENIVRFGRIARIARNVKMPLILTIDYDELPAGVTNLHEEAIKALREDAELSSSHRIHIVGAKATALDLLHWLEQFPRTVISMDLNLLHGLNEAWKNSRPDEELYRHSNALKKFYTYVSMENLSLHSGCPTPHNQHGDFRTPSMLLQAAQEFEELTGTPRDHLHERNAANLVELYDLNPDLLDRSTTTNERRHPDTGPRLTRRELSFVIRTLFGQAPRVDLRDPERTPSRRRASIAEASPTKGRRDEPMETGQAPRHRAQSSAAGTHQSRSPSRQAGGRGRSPSRRATNTNARGSDQAHSARSDQAAKNEHLKKGSQQAHSASWESRSGSSTGREAVAPKKVAAAQKTTQGAAPMPLPQGSALQNRVFKGPPSSSQVPRATADFLAFQEHRDDPAATTSDYRGPSEPIFLVREDRPPPRGTGPRTLVWRSDSRLFKTNPVHDGNLPDAPSVDEIRAHFEQYFEKDPVEGDKLRQVVAGSLTSRTTNFVHGETINVTHEPGPNPSPFDPTQPCGCGDVHPDFHQTVEKFGLVTAKKWANKTCVVNDRTGNGMKWLLGEVMASKIQTFGQMIMLKYADRLKGNGKHTGAVLRFMYEVLQTPDWIGLIDLLREAQSKLVLPQSNGPWPQPSDVYAATESWSCYCPKAYDYVFSRLSGSITFEPDWLSYRLMPDVLKELLGAVDGVDIFDTLRHRLYTEYGLPLVQALREHRPEIHWKRFETSAKSKRELCLTETHETICFVDEFVHKQYAHNLRDSVKMIRVTTQDRDQLLEDVFVRYPTSSVRRVVFWMGRDFLLEEGDNLCLLFAELCHHYEEHFPNIEKYVVMPPYIRRRRVYWTDHVLGTYIQRDEILPNTRVVLLPGDLQLWDYDRRFREAGQPLPPWNRPFVDEEGSSDSDPYLCIQRTHLRQHHGLDLWVEVDEYYDESEDGPAAHSAAEPTSSSPIATTSTGAVAHSAAAPGTPATATRDNVASFIAAGLPAEIITPDVQARIFLATEVLREKITAEVKEYAKQEMQPKVDKIDAVYEYLLQQDQQFQAIPKIAKKPERSRSSSRSHQDPESEH